MTKPGGNQWDFGAQEGLRGIRALFEREGPIPFSCGKPRKSTVASLADGKGAGPLAMRTPNAVTGPRAQAFDGKEEADRPGPAQSEDDRLSAFDRKFCDI